MQGWSVRLLLRRHEVSYCIRSVVCWCWPCARHAWWLCKYMRLLDAACRWIVQLQVVRDPSPHGGNRGRQFATLRSNLQQTYASRRDHEHRTAVCTGAPGLVELHHVFWFYIVLYHTHYILMPCISIGDTRRPLRVSMYLHLLAHPDPIQSHPRPAQFSLSSPKETQPSRQDRGTSISVRARILTSHPVLIVATVAIKYQSDWRGQTPAPSMEHTELNRVTPSITKAALLIRSAC